MQTLEIVPSALALMHSLRAFGYAPESALADLVDNSIAAAATSVEIDIDWNDGDPKVAVLDNGQGFDYDSLVAAMRFGGLGPQAERAETDLGRFGLGLKTASLSQCRRMTVAGRRMSRTVSLAWDIDEVSERKRWDAVIPGEPPSGPFARRLEKRTQGALVIWETMDAIGGLHGLDKESFFLRVQDIRAHLAMVFHRFLSGDARRIAISVNNRAVRPWDPFLRTHPATITMQSERLRHAVAPILVRPYVLPHRDRFENDAAYEAAGGHGGWGERQGFYIYRGKRLVVAGSWLGLGGARAWAREESSRLARIAIDLPLGVDAEWRIDVRKSVAKPPGSLCSRLVAIGSACRDKAREVFAWRGGRARSQAVSHQEHDFLWIAESRSGRFRYRINRAHPVVRAIADHLGEMALLDGLLALIESNVPVERIWLDVSEAEGVGTVRLNPAESAELAKKIAAMVVIFAREGPVADRLDRLMRQLPVDSPALRRSVLQLVEARQ